MNTKEALIALAEGKKIRRPRWPENEYLHITDEGLVDELGRFYKFCTATDYEIYEEPNSKGVTM